MTLIAVLVGSYALGCLVAAYYITRFRHGVDIRSSGSGNAGATNVARLYGRREAAVTLILDGLKGAIAVTAGLLLRWSGLGGGPCACRSHHRPHLARPAAIPRRKGSSDRARWIPDPQPARDADGDRNRARRLRGDTALLPQRPCRDRACRASALGLRPQPRCRCPRGRDLSALPRRAPSGHRRSATSLRKPSRNSAGTCGAW